MKEKWTRKKLRFVAWMLFCGMMMGGCGKQTPNVVEVVDTVETTDTGPTREILEHTEALEDTSETIESELLDETIETIDVKMEDRDPSTSGILERSLQYVETMDSAKYLAESWSHFLDIYDGIVSEYNAGASDGRCDVMQRELEKAKSRLVFVQAEESSHQLPFHTLTKEALKTEMGYGWNLEQTRGMQRTEGPLWLNVNDFTECFQTTWENGFTTVRVTVDTKELLDETGMVMAERLEALQNLVDQATSQDRYIILSITYGRDDKSWSNKAILEETAFYEKYEMIWREVAYFFRDYDEHLIFESMQEALPKELYLQDKKIALINNCNQLFVNVVRSTGSNNVLRWLSTPGRFADGKVMPGGTWGFILPDDREGNNGIFVADHFMNRIDVVNGLCTLKLPMVNALTVTEETVVLPVGEAHQIDYVVVPTKNGDGVLWSSDNPLVASVNHGKIVARGIGTATITAYVPPAKMVKTITVEVVPKTMEETEGFLQKIDVYPVEKPVVCEVGDVRTFVGTEYFSRVEFPLQFRILDPTLLKINQFGTWKALAAGQTEVTVVDAYGNETVIGFLIREKEEVQETNPLDLAINVLYHDESLSYQGNEVGQPITITGPGQYTLEFDCGTDLSPEAKKIGVKGLNHLTAIYIKDYSVTSGEATCSTPSVCKLRYDAIQVDGKKLTLIDDQERSVIKSSGIIDTNGPMNSWGNMEIEEVENVDHVLDFTDMENPQKISITFTITQIED